MENRRQTIIVGAGAQAVEVYARDSRGRRALPTGATVRIVDLDVTEDAAGREVLAEAAATIDSTSTVITAAAGPAEEDPRKITVTSAAGITVGRWYALSNSGRVEAFEVDRIEGLDVYATRPLELAFAASSSSVVGLRVSATFPAEYADDATQLDRDDSPDGRPLFGVDWTFTGVTGPSTARTFAVIERRAKQLRAAASDLLRIDPQLREAQHARGTLEDAVAQADLEIDALLELAGHNLADVTHGTVARLAVMWRAIQYVYQALPDGHERRAADARREADAWIERLTSGRRAADDVEVARSTDARRPRRSRTFASQLT